VARPRDIRCHSRRRNAAGAEATADPAAAIGTTMEIFDAVLRREAAVFGATSVSDIRFPAAGAC